jgi:hypothetical protein
MSENELNWWLARATKRPFLADQINIFGTVPQGGRKYVDWFDKPILEDEEFVKAGKEKIKQLKEELKRKNNGAAS